MKKKLKPSFSSTIHKFLKYIWVVYLQSLKGLKVFAEKSEDIYKSISWRSKLQLAAIARVKYQVSSLILFCIVVQWTTQIIIYFKIFRGYSIDLKIKKSTFNTNFVLQIHFVFCLRAKNHAKFWFFF